MSGVVATENATCIRDYEQNQSVNYNGCQTDFDKSLCWLKSAYNSKVERSCPFTYCNVAECAVVASQYKVTRTCNATGDWEQTDYDQCIYVVQNLRHCLIGFCNKCPDVLREIVMSVSLTLSVVSVFLLVAAILLFSIFDSIQCRRLSIHKNLATAFVFRFSALAIWTIVSSTNFFYDCEKLRPQPLWELESLCKLILWCVIYFQVASVMWMLIEGAYLYSRFTVFAMRHNDAPWYMYVFCGWGIPFLVVMFWTLVHQYKTSHMENGEQSFCWIPYAQGTHLWILAGTMGLALIMNLLFLLGIVIILVQKLRNENAAESKKIWRTIKATLLLVPLLGVSNIPLFYEPEEQTAVYMLGSAILQHSQGIFIAILYCFLNSEIQGAVRRQLAKVPLELFKPKQRFETERTYVPESRNMNSKHGVPMEELNGVKKGIDLPATTFNQVAPESNAIYALSSAPDSKTAETIA